VTSGGELGLLDTWTAALRGSRRDRIVHLSRHVLGPTAGETPWDVATGSLLELVRDMGPDPGPVETVLACEGCGTPIEVPVPVDELLGAAPAADPERASAERVSATGATVVVPTVDDVATAAAVGAEAASLLAAACGVDGLDDRERQHALDALDEAHPLLAPSVLITCPSCGHRAEAAIDVVDLAWAAVAERARVSLDDVVVLARAYGWSEAEVLAVPADRRALYRRAVEEAEPRG
jgi:hypothetical protein